MKTFNAIHFIILKRCSFVMNTEHYLKSSYFHHFGSRNIVIPIYQNAQKALILLQIKRTVPLLTQSISNNYFTINHTQNILATLCICLAQLYTFLSKILFLLNTLVILFYKTLYQHLQ